MMFLGPVKELGADIAASGAFGDHLGVGQLPALPLLAMWDVEPDRVGELGPG